jgi:putative thiamine transport system permease protein
LVFVHLIFVLPYVFLSLSDPWRAWDKRYQFMAFGLGASSNRVFWKVRLPMLLKPVLVAAAVGFAVSIGQYLPTILIGAGRLPTITTEAVALASGGNRRIVGVYAFLQMVLPFLAFALAAAIPALLFKNRKGMRAAP